MRVSTICVASVGAFCAAGCSSGGELPEAFHDDGPPTTDPSVAPDVVHVPFLVDDYFAPNGCFGDRDCGGGVISINSRACLDRPATAQGVCRLYTYSPLAFGVPGYQGFLGILFQDMGPSGEGAIGRVPGLALQPGAQRVVFWAWVASGSVDVHFRAGGANNWEGHSDASLPYRDSFGVLKDATLTKDFQKITIDLTSVTYSDVVSPFGWAITSLGRTEPIKLYIADIRWE